MKIHLFKFCILGWMLVFCLWIEFGASQVDAQSPVNVAGTLRAVTHTDSKHTVESVKDSLHLRTGYTIEVIASEPLVADPVTARLDHRGRLWVVEMPDYPVGPSEGESPRGRIKILDDTNQDGVFDQATVFAKGLMFATGVQPYRDGAFVTLAGQIAFLRDRDGDDQSDETVVLFEGFAEQNQQLRANHPTLSPDGLIYVAGGLRGGSIKAIDARYDQRSEPVDLRDRDFCFDPEGGWWGSVPGKSQFGVSIDDFGRRVGCSNRNPAMMPALTLDAVLRDPLLVGRDAIHDVALSAEKSRVVSRAQAWTTSNLHSGQFSAACGVFAPGWHNGGNEWLLACEPTAYLVQRQRLSREGSVWKSRRESQVSEFLSSTDTWFRPVDITVGPQKSVLIVDMARAVIEHPDFMPSELKTRPDQRDGTALGRIWKVAEKSATPTIVRLQNIDDAIQWLQSESAWQRASASQFLLEKGGAALNPLGELVLDDDISSAARSRSAWLLDKKDALTKQHAVALMKSSDARLRALGVRLSQGRPELLKDVLAMNADVDPLVARNVAAEAGAAADFLPLRVQALANIARQWSSKDEWIRITVASADRALLKNLAQQIASNKQLDLRLLQHLVERVAIESPGDAVAFVLAAGTEGSPDSILNHRQIELLKSWVRGVRKSRQSVPKVVAGLPEPLRVGLQSLVSRSMVTTRDSMVPADLRAACLLLAADFGQVNAPLRELVGDRSPPELRATALPLNLRIDPEWTRAYVVKHVTGMTMTVRAAAVLACVRRLEDAKWFLQQIETGDIPRTVVDPATAKKLRQHPDANVKSAAERLLATDPNRAKVLKLYAGSASTLGNAMVGKNLFKEHCSACHQVGGVGTNVGPDISDSRTKTPAALLTSILDPNAAIDSAFVQHQVLTVDGQVLDGLLVGEAKDAITLQQKGGKRVIVPRDAIERLQAPGVSLMPEGFEEILNPAKMSDLLSYLKNWRYMDGSIPGEIPGRD
ncbi:c-type cytochrome [bacterium]|nr:c-type cytochrome [bacterium]